MRLNNDSYNYRFPNLTLKNCHGNFGPPEIFVLGTKISEETVWADRFFSVILVLLGNNSPTCMVGRSTRNSIDLW